MTTLILCALIGVYGRREVQAWLCESRCMVLGFAAALGLGERS